MLPGILGIVALVLIIGKLGINPKGSSKDVAFSIWLKIVNSCIIIVLEIIIIIVNVLNNNIWIFNALIIVIEIIDIYLATLALSVNKSERKNKREQYDVSERDIVV